MMILTAEVSKKFMIFYGYRTTHCFVFFLNAAGLKSIQAQFVLDILF